LAILWGHVSGDSRVQQVKWIGEHSCDSHATDCSGLSPNEVVKSAVLARTVGYETVLDSIVESHFDKHLHPLFVDMGHHTPPEGLISLSFLDVRDKQACGTWQLMTVR